MFNNMKQRFSIHSLIVSFILYTRRIRVNVQTKCKKLLFYALLAVISYFGNKVICEIKGIKFFGLLALIAIVGNKRNCKIRCIKLMKTHSYFEPECFFRKYLSKNLLLAVKLYFIDHYKMINFLINLKCFQRNENIKFTLVLL